MGLTTREIGSNSFNDMISSIDRRSEFVENRAGANVTTNNALISYGLSNSCSILNAPCGYSNGVYPSLTPIKTFGSELVTNGDFSDGTNDWETEGFSSISVGDYEGRTGVANINISNTASNSRIRQPFNYVNGKRYKVSVDVYVVSGSFRIDCSDSFVSGDFVSTSTTGYWLTLTAEIKAIQTGSNYIWLRGLLEVSQFYVDNISIKEVIDADFDFTRGSSATRINEKGLVQDVQLLSGELVQNGNFEQIGSELITNGSFDTDSDWTKGTGWSIEDGKAVCDGSQTSNSLLQQASILTLNKLYKVSYDLTVDSGQIYVRLGFSGQGAVRSTSGSFTEYITCSGNTNFDFLANATYSGSIDNVSVKEVGQNWLFQNGWNMGDGVAVYSGTVSAYRTIYQENVLTVSSKYRLTFDIVSIASGSIENISQSSPTSYSTVGTKTEDFIATNTDLFLKPTTDADLTIDNISVVEITDDTDLPRINYTNFDYEDGEVVPYSGEGSLLLEPQSTNLVTYSEDFSQWNANEVTTQTGFLAPDGSNNAIKITSTGSQSYLVLSGLSLTGTDTRTIYARTVSGSGTVNLCSYGQNTNNNFTITPQWQRFEVNGTTTATGEPNFYGVDFRFAEANPLTEVIIWGAQAEALSYATSYIPTNGSTTTRLADVCNNSGSSDLINSTEGVLYAEISSLIDNNDGSKSISISSGAYSNNIIIQYSTNTNQIVFKTSPSYTTPIYQPFTVSNITESSKIAFKYKLDDCSFWHNGVKLGSVTSFTPFSFGTLTVLNFDRGDGNEKFEGKCKCVAVFKEALSDTELQKLTTI